MSKKIFVVEDEQDMLDILSFVLTSEGYSVSTFNNGETALKEITHELPDMVLLDLMLPGINGLEICRRLKSERKTKKIPVVIISSRSDEFDVINGIDCGCEDYITKPFNQKILLAKIKSIFNKLELYTNDQCSVIKIDKMIIDSDRYEVSIKAKLIDFTPSEFKILHFFAQNPGYVFSRDKLYQIVHEDGDYYQDRSIDRLITRVRKKIGSYGEYIESLYGVGYRFRDYRNKTD